jgi:hypothetical protein
MARFAQFTQVSIEVIKILKAKEYDGRTTDGE